MGPVWIPCVASRLSLRLLDQSASIANVKRYSDGHFWVSKLALVILRVLGESKKQSEKLIGKYMLFTQSKLREFADFSCKKLEEAKPGVNYFDEPFKHVIVGSFFPEELAAICLRELPTPNEKEWGHANDADIEVKYWTRWNSEFDIPDGIVDAVRILNCAPFLKAMGKVMGIPKIVPDPYFTGGGLTSQ